MALKWMAAMSDLWFDERAAQVAVSFFEKMLVHVEGSGLARRSSWKIGSGRR